MQNFCVHNLKDTVYVIGDVILDKYVKAHANRISPEAPVPVLKYQSTEYRLGGACNVVLNLKKLGVKTKLFGLVGNDQNASIIKKMLDELEIPYFLKTCPNPTITKTRVMDQNHQLLRLDEEDYFDHLDSNVLIKKLLEELKPTNYCIISDYGKNTVCDPQKIIKKSERIIVDPKGSDATKYNGTMLMTPNLKEFNLMNQSKLYTIQSIIQAAQSFRIKHHLKSLVVTLGEHGILLVNDHNSIHHPVHQVKHVKDITGAGDTVIATITTCLTAGLTMERSIIYANFAASIVVQKLGTSFVNFSQLYKVHQEQTTFQKVIQPEHVDQVISDLKQPTQKIVFTNGCFDLIHPGHIRLFNEAKKMGDILIVAVNSDQSIKNLKGPSRPINSLTSRLEILNAFEMIDWIIVFDTNTPLSLIQTIKPDVLVKGGDYTIEQIVGATEVMASGGTVKVVPLLQGHSSTKIIESINTY